MMQKFIYQIIALIFVAIGLIPMPMARRLGNGLGNLWFALDKKHRAIAMNNIRLAVGQELTEAEIEQMTRRVFQNLGQIIFEIGWSLRLNLKDFSRYIHVRGFDHYRNAFLKNKGVIALTAHMGNWELLPVVAAMAGYPLNVVYRPLDFKPLDEFFIHLRTRFGAKLIITAHSMRKILTTIRRKEVVAVLLDQNVDWYNGVFVNFFGKRACTNKGLALIALKTDVPVVPVFLVRTESGFYAEFGPEIELIRTGDKIRDIEENTQRYNHAIEAFIKRYPDQWFWVHQRWKTKAWHPWPRQ